MASHQGKVVCALYLFAPWPPKERQRLWEWQVAGESHAIPTFVTKSFLITVFKWGMNHAGVRLYVCSRTHRVSSLRSPVFKVKDFFLVVVFPLCGLNFWARTARIWGLQRENQGRDTILVVLTLRHGLLNCWERKQWKQNTHYFCSQEFTLLNKDSADTHRLLSFPFAGCSSSFTTPTKAAVSKYLLSDINCFP